MVLTRYIVKTDIPETRRLINASSLFPSNSFVFGYSYKRLCIRNPLFLQPDRSSDFGMNKFYLSVHRFLYTFGYTPVTNGE